MREAQFLQQFDLVAAPAANRRRRPLAHCVNSKNGCLGKGRWVERAGGVGLVMRREKDRAIGTQLRQFAANGFA